MTHPITDEQLMRYARHVILDEVGEEGQAKLLAAKVLVIGAGGLGAPLLLYLAAAGVGTLGVIDYDTVDLTNLQRQVIHTTESVGAPKVASAEAAIRALNPEVKVITYRERLSTYRAYAPGDNPCFRCLFPEPPPEGTVPRCDQAGIFGAVAGALGTLQAAEVLKEILKLGESLNGQLLLYDALATTFRKMKAHRDPACPLCGPQATIRDLSLHAKK
jgi:adenylyltransferase/sulfurtransferase